MGALAAIGIKTADVYARPRVAIVSTGPELVDPGRVLESGQIYDVNKHMLAALVAEHGAVPRLPRTTTDCRMDLACACRMRERRPHRLFGRHFGWCTRLHPRGTRGHGAVLFEGVAVKPGKSTAFGLVNGTPVLALPGYPTACLLNAYVLLVPLLRTLGRLPTKRGGVSAPLSRRITSPEDRHHFTTVRLEDGMAVPVFKKAGDVTSVSEAHGYVAIAPGIAALEEGTVVEIDLF